MEKFVWVVLAVMWLVEMRGFKDVFGLRQVNVDRLGVVSGLTLVFWFFCLTSGS